MRGDIETLVSSDNRGTLDRAPCTGHIQTDSACPVSSFSSRGFQWHLRGGLVYFDENGKVRLLMDADGFSYSDANGTLRAGMGDDGFAYGDANGTLRAGMGDDGFRYSDANGTTRAQLGAAELVTPATGAETRYPAAVVLFDEKNKVIFLQPR